MTLKRFNVNWMDTELAGRGGNGATPSRASLFVCVSPNALAMSVRRGVQLTAAAI